MFERLSTVWKVPLSHDIQYALVIMNFTIDFGSIVEAFDFMSPLVWFRVAFD